MEGQGEGLSQWGRQKTAMGDQSGERGGDGERGGTAGKERRHQRRPANTVRIHG